MILSYLAYRVIGGLTSYEFVTAYEYTMTEETTFTGMVVRDEEVLPSQSGGVLDIVRSEGERVPSGGTVAVVYSDAGAMELEAQIETLELQLTQLNYALEIAQGASAGMKLDSSIRSAALDMQKNLYAGQYGELEQNVSELKALVVRRDFSASAGSAEELAAHIGEVQAQLNGLRAQRRRNTRSVTVSKGGIFSAVCDGYESVLTPEGIESMTPMEFARATPIGAADSNVGKLIFGNTWYFAVNMDEQTASSYKKGSRVRLRFLTEEGGTMTVTVSHLSNLENGQRLVVFSCDEYLPSLTLLRRQNAAVVHASYSGIRVPAQALRKEKGVDGVYCLIGTRAVFKPVDVVTLGSGYYLLKPTKNSDGSESTGTKRLRAGDSVIITAEELYDGKVMALNR